MTRKDLEMKTGDLVKWRPGERDMYGSYGIVMDDFYSNLVKVHWFENCYGDDPQWEQRTNVEVVNES